jgi:hypothetical protein
MILITETEVFGFRAALRGMRNPMESWDKSDSRFDHDDSANEIYYPHDPIPMFHSKWKELGWKVPEWPEIGRNDHELACKLIKSGTEHRKFLRQIVINFVIEAPRYVWQEIDTYKVATVRNSCSTMHKLGHRPLTVEDFIDGDVLPDTLSDLNRLGQEYRDGGRKDYDLVLRMKRRLPEGFLQRAGYHMNYETAMTMFRQRKAHRLAEWRWTGGVKIVNGRQSICDWIYSMPYMAVFLGAAGMIDSEQVHG